MFSNLKRFFYANSDENLNIRKIFKPLYIILSTFGLLAYRIRFDEKSRLTIVKRSIYLNLLCTVTYVLFILSFLVLHIQYVYDSIGESAMTREVMTKLNYVLELVISSLYCVTAYVSAYNNRYTFVKVLNDIANLIEPRNMEIDHLLKNLRFKVNVVIVTFLFIVLLLQICVNFTRSDSFWKMILVFVTFMIPQLIQFTVLCFYYLLVSMLLVLLINIRMQILSLGKYRFIMDCSIKGEAKTIKLQYIETLYVKAFEVKRVINRAFEAPTLVTVMQCFHSMISEAHIIYHGMVIEKDFALHPSINCSIWIIYQIIKIYILARSGTLLKQEIMSIGQALHDIPTERHDIRLLLEIQHFSSLMSQQNKDMTAYGLFTLDATLLTKIISSSAMYMIILVQFDKS